MDTGIRVEDARHAFEVSTANGAEGVLPPTELRDSASSTTAVVSEIRAYGDCVLRFISGDFQVDSASAYLLVYTVGAVSFWPSSAAVPDLNGHVCV